MSLQHDSIVAVQTLRSMRGRDSKMMWMWLSLPLTYGKHNLPFVTAILFVWVQCNWSRSAWDSFRFLTSILQDFGPHFCAHTTLHAKHDFILKLYPAALIHEWYQIHNAEALTNLAGASEDHLTQQLSKIWSDGRRFVLQCLNRDMRCSKEHRPKLSISFRAKRRLHQDITCQFY